MEILRVIIGLSVVVLSFGQRLPNRVGEYKWVPTSLSARLPPNAALVSVDSDGSPIYLGKSIIQGNEQVVVIQPSKMEAVASLKEVVENIPTFEVLTTGNGLAWDSLDNGNIPCGAISTGLSSNNEPLYIGLGRFQDKLIPGKVQMSQQCLFIVHNNKEHCLHDFQILTEPEWLHRKAGDSLPKNTFFGGMGPGNDQHYVARTAVENNVIIGHVHATGIAHAVPNDAIIAPNDYELLCGGNLSWKPPISLQIRPLIGGIRDGKFTYVGRGIVQHPGGTWHIPGEMNWKENSVRSAYFMKIFDISQFELLTMEMLAIV